MTTAMMTPAQVKSLIAEGHWLFLAGSDRALSQLPRGHWIAGTIPYFMTEKGGRVSEEQIHVTFLPREATRLKIKEYSVGDLPTIPQNYFSNGLSLVIIPAFSEVHQSFAKDCWTWPGLFNQPLVGWVTGIDLKAPQAIPMVVNGETGEFTNTKMLVLHLELPPDLVASANIINIFQQGTGDVIQFPESGFEADRALINGKTVSFAKYLLENRIDLQLPLVANYMGAMINVSFRDLSESSGKVRFYAPVFPGVEYRLAKPVGNYEAEFEKALQKQQVKNPLFACNCILNFLYANLEGKTTGGDIPSPMTFGEVAYMLLNQTFVYITLNSVQSRRSI